MIAKAKAISHGINDIRYITGESAIRENNGFISYSFAEPSEK